MPLPFCQFMLVHSQHSLASKPVGVASTNKACCNNSQLRWLNPPLPYNSRCPPKYHSTRTRVEHTTVARGFHTSPRMLADWPCPHSRVPYGMQGAKAIVPDRHEALHTASRTAHCKSQIHSSTLPCNSTLHNICPRHPCGRPQQVAAWVEAGASTSCSLFAPRSRHHAGKCQTRQPPAHTAAVWQWSW